MIAWVYGSGFPKSLDVSKAIDKAAGAEREVIGVAGKSGSVRNSMAGDFAGGEYMSTAPATEAARQWQGWGTALKPALEPITVARKPLIGTVAENVLAHGTGALNVDGCRVGTDERTFESKGIRPGSHNIVGDQWDGGQGPKTVEGRWPANLIHDGSEEVVGLFPETKGGQPMNRMHTDPGRHVASGASRGGIYMHTGFGDSGSAARFFYCAKASKADRDEGLEGMPVRSEAWFQTGNGASGKPSSIEVSKGPRAPRANNHPTVKPTDLMRYLCRLVTPPGGTVLDPFAGSGSTGKAAALEGFRFIGIEREAEYVEIARARIAAAVARAGLF
jgi:site-specific DNA-methyltransferase (adenine-specific)